MIITLSRSSLFLSIGELEGRIIPGFEMFAQSIIRQLKIICLVDHSRRWKTNSVTKSRACSKDQYKQAFLTIFAYFLLKLYWQIYSAFSFSILIQLS